MFAPLKRIAILATALLFPGVAFSYVSIHDINVDNWVPWGSEGFVISVHATVDSGDSWQSSHLNLDNYNDICLDHEDFGPGEHHQVFYVPFNGQTADPDDYFDFRTYDDDICDDDNQYSVWYDRFVDVTREFEWDDVTGFAVQKMFRPASDMEVQIDINCSAGSPGDDTAMIGDGEIQIFPQEFLNPSNPNHNCVITEADVPAGYHALYITNPNQEEGQGLVSTDGCFFYGSGNMRSTNTCQIVNIGLPATFTLTKNWEVFQDDDANFVDPSELVVQLGVECSRVINSGHIADEGICVDDDADSDLDGCTLTHPYDLHKVYWQVTGDATMTLSVDNQGFEPVVCYAYENVRYSNVERSFSSCNYGPEGGFEPMPFEMGPGGSDGCGFVNTVFFEGIPTLSQYGMALMALLMLGVGFVGFRRFV